MPISFQALSNSSYDPISRISIPRPRVLPADLEDGRPGIEYQYSLIRDGEFLDGLGCHGSETMIGEGADREWAYTIDLGYEHLIKTVVGFKNLFIGADDDDYVFLCEFTCGLVLAYAGRTDSDQGIKYTATTTAAALANAGVLISDEKVIAADGTLVLAEVFIPAHVPEE
ncbi:hypothetical protein CXF96_13030 [Stenotrophomonas sp. Betaine-02u-21]|uniref:hypothetical protein n=1 Tax=unclassified Stenotrophomonas TaxID=196198 RepID=UPI000C347302|nr:MULTISPECIES: hypothetical protein [unclassified Stenotrophomonas]PKH73132.1 hypothetical protein CXF96_13030 [Stenotrophomonas sp. Betaine-02u-21]PKH76625.1 hypothetical protein CXF90_00555 [Stenotrophomonas sp. Betaine-02u-23]PKH96023.1 hypothetical protein CXG43_09720 [Stenotrophomonas sp. Bg11-02]